VYRHEPEVVAAQLGGVMGRVKGLGYSRTLTSGAALVAVLVLTGAQSSCENRSSSGGDSNVRVDSNVQVDSNNGAGSSSEVGYRVTSSAQISTVTFVDGDGKMTSDINVDGRSWRGAGPSEHGTVKVFATTSRDGARIECSITIRGKVVQRASAEGSKGTQVVCEATY
jgi:hypothetical protein